eukprot:SAG11_NODE_992_length_6262_cov_2.097193_8_plen_124_part_00
MAFGILLSSKSTNPRFAGLWQSSDEGENWIGPKILVPGFSCCGMLRLVMGMGALFASQHRPHSRRYSSMATWTSVSSTARGQDHPTRLPRVVSSHSPALEGVAPMVRLERSIEMFVGCDRVLL